MTLGMTGLFQILPVSGADSLFYLDRIENTPDLMQSDPAAQLPAGGAAYCGPVAVSNSIVWLSRHGYPGLFKGKTGPNSQGQMALEISRYMHTDNWDGTLPMNFLTGLSDFIRNKGYEIEALTYQGWEEHPRSTELRKDKTIDLNYLLKAMESPKSAAWLKIGWYDYLPDCKKYKRHEGHWVSLIGFGKSKDGTRDPSTLIIHDPAPRSGRAKSHDYVKAALIRGSEQLLPNGMDRLPANRFYKLSGDLKIKEGFDCGILDGAVLLKLK